jgi:hypothetical protein
VPCTEYDNGEHSCGDLSSACECVAWPGLVLLAPAMEWFYPGRGNDSALGVERPHVDEWRQRGW